MNCDAFLLRLLRTLALAFLLIAGSGAEAWAQGSAVATLSRREVGVGDQVDLEVKLSGANQYRWQGSLEVEGLEIRGPIQRQQLGFGNLGQFTLVFSVVPLREGTFTIPSLALSADGKVIRTQPLNLVVKTGVKAPGQAAAPDPSLGMLEIVVPKKTVYVGETVPVEVRLSIDSRVRWQPEAMPDLSGEGFTKQKMPEPKQERGTKDGHETDVLVFRTAITPGRAGKITLGPVEIPYVASVPRAQRARPRSLFDMFDDNIFGDPFYSTNQRFKARAQAVELEVKPVPAAGRPPSFSGAVGTFKFEATGAPSQVKVGDPITMNLRISGRGNFDRIDAPMLVDAAGWRTYPPSANFKADDDLNTKGTKTFSMAVIPETKQTAMPEFAFSYFDPAVEKYVTLKSEPAVLTVSGAVPPPPARRAPATTEEKPAEPAAPSEPSDIVGIRYDEGGGRHSFEPLFRQRGFLFAQAIPLAVLAAWLLRGLRRTDEHTRTIAGWKRERGAAFTKLRGRDLPDQEFLDTAARVVQLDTAMTTGRPPGSIDAGFAIASRNLSPATAETIERIFSARAEALYAGGGGSTEQVSGEERQAILAALGEFERSHART